VGKPQCDHTVFPRHGCNKINEIIAATDTSALSAFRLLVGGSINARGTPRHAEVKLSVQHFFRSVLSKLESYGHCHEEYVRHVERSSPILRKSA
jgi:hypothetical protein